MSGVSIFGDSDIDAMLAEFGQPVVIDGVAHNGLVDERDEESLERPGGGAPQLKRVLVVAVKTAHFPDVQHGSHVLLGPAGAEVEYRVWRRVLLGDGALTELFIKE